MTTISAATFKSRIGKNPSWAAGLTEKTTIKGDLTLKNSAISCLSSHLVFSEGLVKFVNCPNLKVAEGYFEAGWFEGGALENIEKLQAHEAEFHTCGKLAQIAGKFHYRAKFVKCAVEKIHKGFQSNTLELEGNKKLILTDKELWKWSHSLDEEQQREFRLRKNPRLAKLDPMVERLMAQLAEIKLTITHLSPDLAKRIILPKL
jgi:hypothetical protein